MAIDELHLSPIQCSLAEVAVPSPVYSPLQQDHWEEGGGSAVGEDGNSLPLPSSVFIAADAKETAQVVYKQYASPTPGGYPKSEQRRDCTTLSSPNKKKIFKEEHKSERRQSRTKARKIPPPPSSSSSSSLPQKKKRKKRQSTITNNMTLSPPKAVSPSPSTIVLTTGSSPTRRQGRYAFPEKLYQLMEEAVSTGQEHVIAWVKDGKGFLIKDVELFESEFLSKHFGHSKIRSFTRQLSYWGFKRTDTKACRVHEFMHPSFVRGHRSWVHRIVRTPTKGVGIKKGGVYINLRHGIADIPPRQQADLVSTIQEAELDFMQEIVKRNASQILRHSLLDDHRRTNTAAPPRHMVTGDIATANQKQEDTTHMSTTAIPPPRRVSVVLSKNDEGCSALSRDSNHGGKHNEHCCVSDEDDCAEDDVINYLANNKKQPRIIVHSTPTTALPSSIGEVPEVNTAIVPQENGEEVQESTIGEDTVKETPTLVTGHDVFRSPNPAAHSESREDEVLCTPLLTTRLRRQHCKKQSATASSLDISAYAPGKNKRRETKQYPSTTRLVATTSGNPVKTSSVLAVPHQAEGLVPGQVHQDVALFEGRHFHYVNEAHDGLLFCGETNLPSLRQDKKILSPPQGWSYWSGNAFLTKEFNPKTRIEEAQQGQAGEQAEKDTSLLDVLPSGRDCDFMLLADESRPSGILHDELLLLGDQHQCSFRRTELQSPPVLGNCQQSNLSSLYVCDEPLLRDPEQERQRQSGGTTIQDDDEASIFGFYLVHGDGDDKIVHTTAV